MKKETLDKWDLQDLFSDENECQKEVDKAKLEALNFNKKYKNKISNLLAYDLFLAIKEYEIIEETLGKISSYSYLRYSTNLSNNSILNFYQNICDIINEISSELVFFIIEINQISSDKLKKITTTEPLKHYYPFIRDITNSKQYQLDEKVEKILIEKSSSGKNAWIRLFDEIINNLEFTYKGKKLNNSEIFNLLSSKNENVRREAAKIIGKKLKENIKILTYITNTLSNDKFIEDKNRGFKHPISSRNLNNFIEDKIVTNLVNSVKSNYSKISHRYYRIKSKILGKDKLNYWDRNAPLIHQEEEEISFESAQNIVLNAYGNFSKEIADIAKKFFDNRWIDIYPRNGKESGAFAHPTVPSAHPYLLLNYQGKIRDIMTLAHELGHGIHQILAKDNGYLMSSTPLTLSETASVFGEQLTFQEILKNETNNQKKIIIIANKIEDMINTSIRQIAFLEFEKKIHENRRNGEITIEEICNFWMDVQKESLGEIFHFDEEYKYYWSYIPHFIHSPFYVYSYAFGECLVNSLYHEYQQSSKNNFEKEYITMLKSGGKLHHKELLKPFNLDISQNDFWQKGMNVIIGYIDSLEKLLKNTEKK